MKRKILLAAASLLFLSANAQHWHPVNPQVYVSGDVDEVFSMTAPSRNVCWTSLNSITSGVYTQYLIHTSDGGATWMMDSVQGNGTSYPSFQWSNLFGIDANTAYAAMFNGASGNGGIIMKTTDGGNTWTKKSASNMFFGSKAFLDLVHFFNPAQGVAVGDPNNGYFELYTTSDSGNAWTRVPTANIPANLSGEAGIVDLYSAFQDTMWFGTGKGRVYRSVDMGHTWTVSPKFATYLNNVTFIDGRHGFANQNDSLFASTDGGQTWTLTNYTGSFYAEDLKPMPGTNNIVSCGYLKVNATHGVRGSSISSDFGMTWTNISFANNIPWHDSVTVDCMAFADSVGGYAGGMHMVNNPDSASALVNGTVMFLWNIPPPSLAGITPNKGFAQTAILGTITGINTKFKTATSDSVWFMQAGSPRVLATNVSATNESTLTFSVTFPSTASGFYDVYVKDNQEGQLMLSQAFNVQNETGINSLSAHQLSVYPNPAGNSLYVNLLPGQENLTFSIYNVLGAKVKTILPNSSASTAELNISDLEKGVYLIEIQSSTAVYTGKFIKE